MTPLVYQAGRFLMIPCSGEKEAVVFPPEHTSDSRPIQNVSTLLKQIFHPYFILVDQEKEIRISPAALRRLWRVAQDDDVGMVYADYYERNHRGNRPQPLTDYQLGSLRDDFRFGPLVLFKCLAIQSVLKKYGALPKDAEAALYDLRLKLSTDFRIVHIPEYLYVAEEKQILKDKKAGAMPEAHFAYVARKNFLRQKQFEKLATQHLKRIGAYLPARRKTLARPLNGLQWKASVVIPVLNRKKTIAQAIQSALEQKTDFPFNILVVDNHSTDGTTGIVQRFASRYPHVHHLVPSRRNLGIGGCWNEAVHSPYCGRYVVQLDSDDLYSSSRTLQKIVDTLRRGRFAMVVGSYTLVDEHLKKIPPGLIAHREWTDANGHNNLLRVNGMGAPRAFDVTVLREIGFPNVSYGEDYAVALRITREYKVGRIYQNLYWCRRWKHNTDAGLSLEQQNRNDTYKDRLRSEEIRARQHLNEITSILKNKTFATYAPKSNRSLTTLCRELYHSQKKTWTDLARACRNLDEVQMKKLSGEDEIWLQFNPDRAVSSGAAVDAESIKSRPCFLCVENLPAQQQGILYRNRYLILCNPAPIFKNHFTIVSVSHEPQNLASGLAEFLRLSAEAGPTYAVFYNGPTCGASAPDHLHFQMVPREVLPFLKKSWRFGPAKMKSSVENKISEKANRAAVILASSNAKALEKRLLHLVEVVRKTLKTQSEPMMNVLCSFAKGRWMLIVFLRQKHRPAAYFREGKERIFVSPGAVDMAGVVITPLLENYQRLAYDDITAIYRDVSLSADAVRLMMEQFKGEKCFSQKT